MQAKKVVVQTRRRAFNLHKARLACAWVTVKLATSRIPHSELHTLILPFCKTSMSTHPHRKLHAAPEGQPPHQITLFKSRWIELSDSERDTWYEFIFSTASHKKICERILNEFKLDLDSRYQIQRLREWLLQEHEALLGARRIHKRVEELKKENPNATLDEIREKVLQEAFFYALASEEYKTGLQTINAHCRTQSVELSQRRYNDSRRSAEAKATRFCLDETRDYPEVQELFKQAFAAFRKARATK